MSNRKDAPTKPDVEPGTPVPAGVRDGELGDELSRFARRLAGFGLGEALDAMLPHRKLKESGVPPDPKPC